MFSVHSSSKGQVVGQYAYLMSKSPKKLALQTGFLLGVRWQIYSASPDKGDTSWCLHRHYLIIDTISEWYMGWIMIA